MIQFLDTNAKDFFNLPPVRLPFGTGPWPCLNPMSQHFREPIINQYKLSYTKLTGKPKAVFTCQCGLVYSRVNPDPCLESRYSATGFEVVTPAWLDELKRLSAMSIPTEVLTTRFCTNSKALQEVLTERDFVYSLKTIRLDQLKKLSDNVNGDQYLIQRDRRRKLWLEYLNANPPPSRSVLCKKHQSLFYRILMDDKHWLQKHLPPRQRARGPGPRIDWAQKDQQLAKSVREEARRMKDAPGRPVRISLTCLARRIGKLAVISKRRHLLPLTWKALTQVSESVQEYAIRRVKWASESFRATAIVPTVRQIQWRAAVSASIAKDPMVKDAIEESARQLINIAQTASPEILTPRNSGHGTSPAV